MITFKEFMQESSLSRIKSKSDKGGIATLSADRGKFGKGATKVTGKYLEKDEKTGEEKKVKERSHVVTSGKMGKRKFKKAVKALGKKYDQDSVITQTKGGGDAILKRTRKGGLPKRNIKLGKMKPQGKNPEAETQIKGKTFTYG